MTPVFFLFEELNNDYDSHKIIRVVLLVLTFCFKTSIQNRFCSVLAFDSKQALNIQVKRENGEIWLSGLSGECSHCSNLVPAGTAVGFESESDDETFQIDILLSRAYLIIKWSRLSYNLQLVSRTVSSR